MQGRRRKRSRAKWVAGGTALVVVVAGAAAGGFVVHQQRQHAAAVKAERQAASAFLQAWSRGDDPAQVAVVAAPPADLAATLAGTRTRLGVTAAAYTLTGLRPGSHPSFSYHAAVTVAGLTTTPGVGAAAGQQETGPWQYDGSAALVRHGSRYLVAWAPEVLHPALHAGQQLARVRTLGTRGQVLLADGRPVRGNDADLSANLVGSVGPLAAAQATAAGSRFLAGDVAGQNGLERAYNDTLAGQPGGDIEVQDAKTGKRVQVLSTYTPTNGTNVTLSLDLRTQQAGEAALANLGKNSALVAIDTNTGQVKALVNAPPAGVGRAANSYYPPGSTFKTITLTAALLAGKTPETPLNCTPTVTVDGRSFANAEAEAFGTISLRDAYARSCNTAFINLEQSLPAGAVQQAAELFGFNLKTDPLPIASKGGSYPATTGPVEAAAAAIGQAKVQASPLQMASVAAAVASGTWRQPSVVTAPAPAGLVSHPLPAGVAPTVASLMRSVVTDGTGTAANNVPGGPVQGKTGTAEYGTANPPRTHAWFIGFQGATAFCVFVEDGGFGAATAAPAAARFLTNLAG